MKEKKYESFVVKGDHSLRGARDGQNYLYWSKQKHTFINSHEWPKQNFSIQFHYNIKQTSDENEENINLEIISWPNTKFSKLTSWEVL